MKKLSLLVLVTTLFTGTALFANNSAEDTSIAKLTEALAKTMPKVKASKITATQIPGLYQVIVGSQIVYMSDDARYMIEGDLYDLNTKKNITDDAKSDIRLAALDELGEDQMLIYTAEKSEHTITVITDIDCPYCRKLHAEVPFYNGSKVTVRYLFMPLKGAADMAKTISVWCSDDPQLSLDIAKAGGEIEEAKCENPIKKHLNLARQLGVRGTPAIILDDGQMLPGYIPFDKVVAELRK